jgi:hypothetical protein
VWKKGEGAVRRCWGREGRRRFAHTAQYLTTEAVRPAAEEALPEVYTARGRKSHTYLHERSDAWEAGKRGAHVRER